MFLVLVNLTKNIYIYRVFSSLYMIKKKENFISKNNRIWKICPVMFINIYAFLIRLKVAKIWVRGLGRSRIFSSSISTSKQASEHFECWILRTKKFRNFFFAFDDWKLDFIHKTILILRNKKAAKRFEKCFRKLYFNYHLFN
jgi:hypothetical protein